MVPVIFALVAFGGAFHDGILPTPFVAKSPIAVLEFVQLNEAPVGILAKLPILICVPGQTAMLVIGLTEGVGYTDILKLIVVN